MVNTDPPQPQFPKCEAAHLPTVSHHIKWAVFPETLRIGLVEADGEAISDKQLGLEIEGAGVREVRGVKSPIQLRWPGWNTSAESQSETRRVGDLRRTGNGNRWVLYRSRASLTTDPSAMSTPT